MSAANYALCLYGHYEPLDIVCTADINYFSDSNKDLVNQIVNDLRHAEAEKIVIL